MTKSAYSQVRVLAASTYTMSKKPWDYHDDLSRDHLQLVGKTLRDVRTETLKLHDPASGDTAWSFGCRVYARTTETLSRQAETLWPWLKVVKPPLEFIFSIGAVPVRFFHGDADHPRGNQLRVSPAEQVQGNFAFGNAYVDLIWRIAVETNVVGETDRIVFVGMTPNGEIDCRYEIPPLDDSVSLIAPNRPASKSPVILAPPVVRPRRAQSEDRKEDDDGKQSL